MTTVVGLNENLILVCDIVDSYPNIKILILCAYKQIGDKLRIDFRVYIIIGFV